MTADRFLDRLRLGDRQVGLWQNLPGTPAAEIAAASGVDWVLFDQEHAPRSIEALTASINAAERRGADVIVRAFSGDPHEIGRLLDLGVANVLVPMVESAEQAAAVVAACAFPPEGTRGVSSQTRAGSWGTDPEFLHRAREDVCLIVQIESATGVAAASEIIATPGVDAVFIGAADLAATMGHLGDPRHPRVVAAVDRIVELARAAGMPLGTLVRGADAAEAAFAQGYGFVGVGTDSSLLATTLRSILDPLLPPRKAHHG